MPRLGQRNRTRGKRVAASRQDISTWFDRGVAEGKARMIIWCDTYDWDDYPEYVPDFGDETAEVVREMIKIKDGSNMQRLMEVYNLQMDKDAQMNEHRARNY